MNIFKRLLKIGQAEIHAFVEKLEDPISLTEQGIRDMNDQLSETTEAYANARALVIRGENKLRSIQTETLEYEEKAKRLLQKAQSGEIEHKHAEKLALEALGIKKTLLEEYKALQEEVRSYEQKAKDINNSIEVLKFNISKWEKELTTLKAKEKLNTATVFANKQMAAIDQNSTIEMLERMKAKTEQEEALANAFGEIAKDKIDRDIDLALRKTDSLENELEALKRQLKADTDEKI